MAYNHEYPYVDPNRYNSDWILNKMKELEGEMGTFTALNKITFAGEWNITKQYPAWAIVNTDNGQQGFISIRPVPAGVTIDNTDYWATVVDYTATIADLQNRVITLEGDMEDAQEAISLMNHHRYVFIGDSYNTTDTPSGGVPIVPWSGLLAQYLGLSASDYYNIGRSGSGFANPVQFIDLLNTVSASVTDKDSITDVVVLGGINDISQSLSDLNTALDDFIARATELYPNAMITIGFISWSRNLSSRALMLPILQYYDDKQKYPNVRTITNGFKFFHHYYAMYQPDGHPNAVGSGYIARGIANFLKNGSTDVHWVTDAENVTFDSALNVTQQNTPMTIKFEQQNDMIITHIDPGSYFRSSGFTIDTDSEITLGTFPYRLADFSKISPIEGHMYVYNGSYYNVSFRLIFEHDTIKIRFLEVGGGATGSQQITGVTMAKMNFPGFFITPIEYC